MPLAAVNRPPEELVRLFQVDPGGNTTVQEVSTNKAMTTASRQGQSRNLRHAKRNRSPEANLKPSGDTKAVYEQLGKSFGVKATFDPDLIPEVPPAKSRRGFLHCHGAPRFAIGDPLAPWIHLDVYRSRHARKRRSTLSRQRSLPLSAPSAPRRHRDTAPSSATSPEERASIIDTRAAPSPCATRREAARLPDFYIDRTTEKAEGKWEVMLEIETSRSRPQQSARAWITTPASSEQSSRLNTANINEAQSVDKPEHLSPIQKSSPRRALRHSRRCTHWEALHFSRFTAHRQFSASPRWL